MASTCKQMRFSRVLRSCFLALTVCIFGEGSIAVCDDLLTICQLQQQASHWDGKSVRIQGFLIGPGHGFSISPFEHGIQSCESSRKMGYSGIFLEDNTSALQEPGRVLLHQVYERRRKRRDHTPIWVEAVGRIEVRSPFRIRCLPNGSCVGNGFGQMGRYRVQLVIGSVREVARPR